MKLLRIVVGLGVLGLLCINPVTLILVIVLGIGLGVLAVGWVVWFLIAVLLGGYSRRI